MLFKAFNKWKGRKDDLDQICRECSKLKRLNLKYGLSSDEHTALIYKQDSVCAICKRSDELFVDHCHSTGAVRGLLCSNCNVGIGLFRDNIESMKNAVAYLKADLSENRP